MARTSSIVKQARRKAMVQANWSKRQELKKKIRDLSIAEEEKQQAISDLNKLPKNSSPTRLRNRCALTGRARGVYRKFMLSRLCFREMASNGLIPGVTKASW